MMIPLEKKKSPVVNSTSPDARKSVSQPILGVPAVGDFQVSTLTRLQCHSILTAGAEPAVSLPNSASYQPQSVSSLAIFLQSPVKTGFGKQHKLPPDACSSLGLNGSGLKAGRVGPRVLTMQTEITQKLQGSIFWGLWGFRHRSREWRSRSHSAAGIIPAQTIWLETARPLTRIPEEHLRWVLWLQEQLVKQKEPLCRGHTDPVPQLTNPPVADFLGRGTTQRSGLKLSGEKNATRLCKGSVTFYKVNKH